MPYCFLVAKTEFVVGCSMQTAVASSMQEEAAEGAAMAALCARLPNAGHWQVLSCQAGCGDCEQSCPPGPCPSASMSQQRLLPSHPLAAPSPDSGSQGGGRRGRDRHHCQRHLPGHPSHVLFRLCCWVRYRPGSDGWPAFRRSCAVVLGQRSPRGGSTDSTATSPGCGLHQATELAA